MAQPRKRVGTTSSRSASSPPGLGNARMRSSSQSARENNESAKQNYVSWPYADKAENGSAEGYGADGNNKTYLLRSQTSRTADSISAIPGSTSLGCSFGTVRTSKELIEEDEQKHLVSNPEDPQAVYFAEAELPSEDFVEGGVELSPSECGVDGDPESDIHATAPTRPLPPWGDRQLEEFWPAGDGPRALFLDYDGTLREFEARPELATPTAELEELLRAINGRQDLVPHIISGRDAQFLGKCFGELNRFTLIAEHGFQIWRPGTEGWELTDHPDGLDRDHDDWKAIVRKEMQIFVDKMPISHIEEKASALVWHYREVPEQEKAEKVALEAMERLERLRDSEKIHKIRISHGHKVVEVSYRKVRKGPVMRRICEEKALFGEPFLSVLVAGDDVSDESMFDIAPRDFLTIKVGPAQSLAQFRVDSPLHLRRFLSQLAGPV